MWTLVPCMLKLCTTDPAFVTDSLPLSGAAMVAGVIANSLKRHLHRARGRADLAVVGVRGDDEGEEPEHHRDRTRTTTPAVPTASRSFRLNNGMGCVLW